MARLYQWYIEEIPGGKVILWGVVTGHRKLPDGMFIHTSSIRRVFRDPEHEDGYIFQSKNTDFHVLLADGDYGQCAVIENSAIPGLNLWYSEWKMYSKRYAGRKSSCSAECGSILLRLGNNREYYFDAMDVDPGTGVHLSGTMRPHIGMTQDSVLCWAGGEAWCGVYDLRYFPYCSGNLEFYNWDTGGLPVYVENIGDSDLRIRLDGAVYLIAPGNCVMMEKTNAQSGAVLTSNRDLYGAEWFVPASDDEFKALTNQINGDPKTEEEA